MHFPLLTTREYLVNAFLEEVKKSRIPILNLKDIFIDNLYNNGNERELIVQLNLKCCSRKLIDKVKLIAGKYFKLKTCFDILGAHKITPHMRNIVDKYEFYSRTNATQAVIDKNTDEIVNSLLSFKCEYSKKEAALFHLFPKIHFEYCIVNRLENKILELLPELKDHIPTLKSYFSTSFNTSNLNNFTLGINKFVKTFLHDSKEYKSKIICIGEKYFKIQNCLKILNIDPAVTPFVEKLTDHYEIQSFENGLKQEFDDCAFITSLLNVQKIEPYKRMQVIHSLFPVQYKFEEYLGISFMNQIALFLPECSHAEMSSLRAKFIRSLPKGNPESFSLDITIWLAESKTLLINDEIRKKIKLFAERYFNIQKCFRLLGTPFIVTAFLERLIELYITNRKECDESEKINFKNQDLIKCLIMDLEEFEYKKNQALNFLFPLGLEKKDIQKIKTPKNEFILKLHQIPKNEGALKAYTFDSVLFVKDNKNQHMLFEEFCKGSARKSELRVREIQTTLAKEWQQMQLKPIIQRESAQGQKKEVISAPKPIK